MRIVIAFIKITAFILLSIITIPVQCLSGLLFSKSPLFYFIPTSYYSLTCKIFRIRSTLLGDITRDGRTIYVGNHLSYIDIAVIGSTLPATFISKAEIAKWPIFGILAKTGRTIFIERNRNAAEPALEKIQKTLGTGRSLILFPEGTSTQGIKVLPFKSTVFDIFLSSELKNDLLVQPFTITLTKVDKKTVQSIADHDLYSWYGDMTFLPHLWQLAKSHGVEVLVTLHQPKAAKDFNDRKVFARACEQDVAQGLKNTLPQTLDFKTHTA